MYYSVKEVAKILSLCEITIYNYIEKGLLKCKRVGKGRGVIRITQKDIDDFINEKEFYKDEVD